MGNNKRIFRGTIGARSLNGLPSIDVPFVFVDLGVTVEEKQVLTDFPVDKCEALYYIEKRNATEEFFQDSFCEEKLNKISTNPSEEELKSICSIIDRLKKDFVRDIDELCHSRGAGGIDFSTLEYDIGSDKQTEGERPFWHLDSTSDSEKVCILEENTFSLVADLKGNYNTWFYNATETERNYLGNGPSGLQHLFPTDSKSDKIVSAKAFHGTYFEEGSAVHATPCIGTDSDERIFMSMSAACVDVERYACPGAPAAFSEDIDKF